jgi:hypothetical protein
MSQIDHKRILNAYLSRLSTKQLENILNADKECLQAAMNYGNRAQLDAQVNFYDVVCKAVDSMIEHDLSIVESILNEEFVA